MSQDFPDLTRSYENICLAFYGSESLELSMDYTYIEKYTHIKMASILNDDVRRDIACLK